MPLPMPAERAPIPIHIVFCPGGAMLTVQTVAQTPCSDCVAPMRNFAAYIGPLERRLPKMAVQRVFSVRPKTRRSLVLQSCNDRPQSMEVAVMPILSMAPRRPNSAGDHALSISSWMVSKLAGVAPPS